MFSFITINCLGKNFKKISYSRLCSINIHSRFSLHNCDFIRENRAIDKLNLNITMKNTLRLHFFLNEKGRMKNIL